MINEPEMTLEDVLDFIDKNQDAEIAALIEENAMAKFLKLEEKEKADAMARGLK